LDENVTQVQCRKKQDCILIFVFINVNDIDDEFAESFVVQVLVISFYNHLENYSHFITGIYIGNLNFVHVHKISVSKIKIFVKVL
jgi:hypothetical protein